MLIYIYAVAKYSTQLLFDWPHLTLHSGQIHITYESRLIQILDLPGIIIRDFYTRHFQEERCLLKHASIRQISLFYHKSSCLFRPLINKRVENFSYKGCHAFRKRQQSVNIFLVGSCLMIFVTKLIVFIIIIIITLLMCQ